MLAKIIGTVLLYLFMAIVLVVAVVVVVSLVAAVVAEMPQGLVGDLFAARGTDVPVIPFRSTPFSV